MKRQNVVGLVVLLVLGVTLTAPAEPRLSWGLQVAPEGSLPLGGSTAYYSIGPGARLAVDLGLPGFRLLTPFIDLGYLLLPVKTAGPAPAYLSLIRTGAGGI